MKSTSPNFVAIDIGSSKIAGLASYIDRTGTIRILSQTLHYSEGIRSGVITDLASAENSIIGAIYDLEKDCNRNIREVSISLSGTQTKSYYIVSKIKVSRSVISKIDLRKLLQKALSEFSVKDKEIIHYFPVEYFVDNNDYIENPVGMIGQELGCRLHVITAHSWLLANLTKCFAKYRIKINHVILGIYATSLSVLSDDEKKLGCLVIDIGARTTSFIVFLNNKPVYTGHVDIGSWHITYDIAKVFSLNLASAEKLKILYGDISSAGFNQNQTINISEFEPENSYNQNLVISSNKLSEVIESRLAEILLMVKKEYDQIKLDHLIASRLVITGGGALLRGIKELSSKIFQKQVEISKPMSCIGFTEDCGHNMYGAALGMLKLFSSKVSNNFTELGDLGQKRSLLQKIMEWVKENI